MDIYIVTAHGGQWEDSWENPVKAFASKEKAQKFMDTLVKKDDAFIDKAQEILSEFEDNPKAYDIKVALWDMVSYYSIDELELEMDEGGSYELL